VVTLPSFLRSFDKLEDDGEPVASRSSDDRSCQASTACDDVLTVNKPQEVKANWLIAQSQKSNQKN
jgi:hypothetical protein